MLNVITALPLTLRSLRSGQHLARCGALQGGRSRQLGSAIDALICHQESCAAWPMVSVPEDRQE
jgi:hypothetical protein